MLADALRRVTRPNTMLLWILLSDFFTAALSCGYPGSPSHSTVTFNTDAVQTGSVATYRCDPGFDLLGPIRRLCVENGTWIPLGVPVCVMNVAAGKAAMQSSILAKGVPQRAVDGSTSRNFASDTCTQTEAQESPWWYVNLLEPFLVQLVRVDFGRSCCANNVPATVIVRVGNNRPDLSDNPICNKFTGKIEEGRPLFFPCTSTVSGAFVSVHVDTALPLSLSICEAFVYTDQVVPVDQCPKFEDEGTTDVATYNGKCYRFRSDDPRTLEGAAKACAAQGGGSLVHETSPALQGFLSWELYKRHRKRPGSDYWNGLIRKDSGDWVWLDGKDVIISFWSVPPTNENCSRFDGTNGWLWSETDCTDKLNYICEYRPVTCGKPERPVNSSVLVRSSAVGSVIEYQCDPGHLLLGPSARTCLQTGFFSEFAPKCSYLECGFPATIPNGGYNLLNGTRHLGSSVRYFCQESFVLVGKADLLCDADRKWDGPPPRCDPLLCHNPPSIVHGNVTVTVNTTVPGTTAEYSCEDNFRMVGEPVISCDSTGFWTDKPPACELDKEKLYHAKMEQGKHKRNRASIAARLNMGGIIALGIFGGFVFLAVIISIVVIIVRRNSSNQDSLESLSTYESGGSREKLYQRQCWTGPHPPNPIEDPQKDPHLHQHRNHRHHHLHPGGSRESSDITLEASTSRWCPKHEKRGY